MEAVALRFFNVYGTGQRADGAYAAVIPKFIEMALAGRAATIFGDGQQARDFVHVDDVAGASMLATQPWENELTHVYNVCTRTECSLLDLMAEIHGVLEDVAPDISRHAPTTDRTGGGHRPLDRLQCSVARGHRLGAEGCVFRGLRQRPRHPSGGVTGVHVLWFTGRSMTDLCSTTQRALMTGMMEANLAITF